MILWAHGREPCIMQKPKLKSHKFILECASNIFQPSSQKLVVRWWRNKLRKKQVAFVGKAQPQVTSGLGLQPPTPSKILNSDINLPLYTSLSSLFLFV